MDNDAEDSARSGEEPTSRRLSDEEARDSLHILPLAVIPLQTPGLQRSRLIKNVRLETVIELFNDTVAGSGQVRPKDISAFFGPSHQKLIEQDLTKIHKICQLNSFDVYSLRIELRRMQIDVNNVEELSLSARKRAELTDYMKSFTRPLIKYVFGQDQVEINDVYDIISMFSSPNREEAIKNLKEMAEKLKIGLQDIPQFLEDYGDIFLSLAYFRRCVDEVVPETERFIEWARECRNSNEIKRDFRLARIIDQINSDITDITTSITGRFESFDNRSKDFWTNINAETFHTIRGLIASHHVTIGGVLCGLAVKMNLWKLRFARGGGGPNRRMEFIKSEILPGLHHIKALEHAARDMPR